MSEALELFLILGLIYLLECAQWVPRAARGFSRLFPGAWRARQPWSPSGHWLRGAVLGTPWPPMSSPLICEELTLVFGPAGVLVGKALTPWEQLGLVRSAETQVLLGNRVLVSCATRRGASSLADSLRQLVAAKTSKRERKLGQLLDERCSPERVRQRLAGFSRRSRWLTVCQNALWLTLFVATPALIFSPLILLWPLLALALLLGWLLTALLFALALRDAELIPHALWPDRLHRWLIYLSPLAALRARDLIAREQLGDLEPLAVAAALLPTTDFAEQARLALVQSEAGALPPSEAGRQAARWWRAQRRRRLEQLCVDRGLSVEHLLAPPSPENERCLAYCPRCLAQYERGERCTSESCRDMPLVPFTRQAGGEGQGAAVADQHQLKE